MTALALFAGAPASAESRARSDGRPGGPLPIELLGMPSTARRPTALLDQHRLTLLVHENTRLQRAEIRARHRLEALHTLSTTLTRSLDLATVLDLIAGNLDTFIGTGRGHVWLWDEQRRLLVGHDASSAEPALRPGEDVEGVVVASRRGLMVNDYRSWPHARPSVLARTGVTARMGEPLLYDGRLLGVLAIDNGRVGRPFTDEERGLLALYAAQASVAIANAELFAQIEADHAQLERLSHRLVEVQEAERRSIARELHDEIGQALTGLRLLLDLSADTAPPSNRAHLESARDLVHLLLSRVRELSLDLRPSMLDDLGLLPALLWHLDQYRNRTGVAVDFRHVGIEGRRFPAELETAAYRVVQEALTNVARHAVVRDASVRVWATPGTLEVQVEDRGRGFDVAAALAAHTTSGLSGIRERVTLLGGLLVLDSAPGSGTSLVASLPLSRNGRPSPRPSSTSRDA